jgi:hypothetical protein
VSIELTTINAHLSERRIGYLSGAVAALDSAVAAGMVPNKLFTDAKGTINYAVNEAVEAFLKTGPHEAKHHQSDWWLGAYHADALVSGTHGIPAALKRVKKAGNLTAYEAFLTALLPLRELLERAKPLIKKGELPKVRSPKQIVEDSKRMTCQCCGRAILAETGVIAHHGYERPDYGYQTASCMGARELPFEVDRAVLGKMIIFMKGELDRRIKHRASIKGEKEPIVIDYETQQIGPSRYQTFRRGEWPMVKRTFAVTRESFAAYLEGPGRNSHSVRDYETYKARHVEGLTSNIEYLRKQIDIEQARYDGWAQTHEWKGGQWVALSEAAQ